MADTAGSTTKDILPGEQSVGITKHSDFPHPVGYTTIASYPCLNAAAHST